MSILGNIIWFVCGGIIGGFIWGVVGILWCISILGIPVGVQCFKFARLAFFPFGKEVEYSNSSFSFVVNIIWIVTCGWEMCMAYLTVGIIFYCSIIGIPFGKQFFKLARLSLLPFGANIK